MSETSNSETGDSETGTRARRLSDLANPTRFLALADRILPWLAGSAFVVLAVGLWLGFAAPEDFQQGITVRIMYIHVPFAWLSMLCYSLMALAALGTLVWRHPLADVALKAAAPLRQSCEAPHGRPAVRPMGETRRLPRQRSWKRA